jgi:high-affinity iron transporter
VQATVEGLGAAIAVVVLTWMLFWMRRQGRALKGDLERNVASAVARGSAIALVAMSFLAVAREGFETVLFLLAVLGARGDTVPALLSALAGIAVAAAIGWAIFAMGIRVNLRRFFTVTGVLLIFVAAGLVSYAIAELTEAGLLPVTPIAFDVSPVLPETSPLGSVLAGLVGYRASPSVLQAAGYLLYLVPVLILFLGDGLLPVRRRQAATT